MAHNEQLRSHQSAHNYSVEQPQRYCCFSPYHYQYMWTDKELLQYEAAVYHHEKISSLVTKPLALATKTARSSVSLQ